jgi:hypothetical protein
LDSRVAKLLRIGVPILGQAENDFRELEPGCLYRRWAGADAGGDPFPGFVKSLPESLQLLWIVRRTLDEPTGFHSGRPQQRERQLRTIYSIRDC